MIANEIPKISVVIPCYNAAETIVEQLDSINTQENAPPFEVVVINNGSTDDSEEIVRRYQDRARFPLDLINANALQGASYARNEGIKVSRAERIMFCDADDVVSRWWISQGAKCFEQTEVWSGAAILLSDNEFLGGVEAIRSNFGDSAEFEALIPSSKEAFPVLMGGNFGATREAISKVGGFDQSLVGAGEDNDLGFRFAQAGYHFPTAPSVRIGYRGKWDSAAIRRHAFRQAKAHALIASRYDAWSTSNMAKPETELLRVLGSSIKMVAGTKDRDWPGLTNRASIVAGLLVGKFQYVFPRLRPTVDLGLGLKANHK